MFTQQRDVKSRLVVFFSLIFVIGLFSNALTALGSEYGSLSVPQDCMEQIREEGSELRIYDWAGWWPEEIYEGFSKEFGVKIIRDNYASHNEMLTKFKLHPEAKYDVVLAATKPFVQLKEWGILQKINHDWVPNVNKYLMKRIKDAWYDPGYQYGVTTYLCYVTYAFNSKYVSESDPRIPSWALLFEGKEYAGKITMVDNMDFVIGSALKYLGFSANSTNEEELRMAEKLLLHQKPWVVAYNSWPKRLVLQEEVWISQLWSGDSWFLHQELESIKGALPPEGSIIDPDCVVIPKSAPHPAAAHLWMNYLFRPEVYTLLIKTIGYTPVHIKAAELIPEEMKKWPGVFPSKEFLDKSEYPRPESFTGKGKELRMEIWEKLKG